MNVAFYMYSILQLIAMLPWQYMVVPLAISLIIIDYSLNIKE
jgi:hypothetical protein